MYNDPWCKTPIIVGVARLHKSGQRVSPTDYKNTRLARHSSFLLHWLHSTVVLVRLFTCDPQVNVMLSLFCMLIALLQVCKCCLQSLNDPVDISSRLVDHRDTHMAITLPVSDASSVKHDLAYPIRKYLSMGNTIFVSLEQDTASPRGTTHP